MKGHNLMVFISWSNQIVPLLRGKKGEVHENSEFFEVPGSIGKMIIVIMTIL
jgi:hypothetical protein